MNQTNSCLRISTCAAPAQVRILPSSLADHHLARQAQRDDQLRQEGFSLATAETAQLFEQAIADLGQHRESLLLSMAEMTATLASEVAQTLLCKELAQGNYDIAAIVRECLAGTGSSPGETIIHVHPDDAAALESVRFRSGTSVQADPSIRRGNVQVETSQGLLVRDIDERISAIRDALREALTPC